MSAPCKTKVANVTPKRTARLFSNWPQALLNGLDMFGFSCFGMSWQCLSFESLSSFIQPTLSSWEGMSNQVRLQLCAEDHFRDGHPTTLACAIRRCVEVEMHCQGTS